MADHPPFGPPRFSEKLIAWLCREELLEEILGNLYEFYEYQQREARTGMISKLSYWYQVITYLRPSTLKNPFSLSIDTPMFHFDFRIAFRNLWKNRTHSLLNLAGFCLGMVCFILLFFHIRSELSHDNFHPDKDQMYRVIRESDMRGERYQIGVTSAPYANALMLDYPNRIKEVVRVAFRDRTVKYEDEMYQEDEFVYADSNFFEFFGFPLIAGDANQVLQNPGSVVLSKAMAEKYFGNQNPIGKMLEVNNDEQMLVTGIMGEASAKSHLEMDFVATLSIYNGSQFMNGWWWNSLCTYAKIPDRAEASAVETLFPDFMDKYFGEDFERNGIRIDLKLEPMSEVYFNHLTRYDPVRHGNKRSVYILIVVAAAILLIAAFNYLNLSIATTYGRAREVGIRKVMGSNTRRLTMQFLGEALMLISGSFLLAILISSTIHPLFNQYFGLEVPLEWKDPQIWLFLGILLGIMVLLSGFYPAILFASFRPVETLKGKLFSFGKSLWMRKGLVIAQFVIAIFMIISTLLIGRQLSFVEDKDLGFNQESIVMVSINNEEIFENVQLFRDRLAQSPHIVSLSNATGEPGGFHDATTVEVNHRDENVRLRTLFADYDYIPVFDIKLIAGRNFSREMSTDEGRTAILNQTAVRELGWTAEEAIGQHIFLTMFDSLERQIIGVVEDYHFSSLRDHIEPLIMALSDRSWQMAIRIKEGEISAGIADIQKSWEELAPNNPFAYRFLDESLAQLYEQEQKQQKVYSAFALIAIFLACLGVFGLISHSTLERKKEFNIRKVLGARMDQILVLIYREFVWLIAIASIVAIPLSWWFINNWLADFAYRIETVHYWYLFVLGSLITLVIAVMTMSFRALGAAKGDPAEGLRYE